MNADDSIMSQCVGLSSKFMLSVPIMGILFRLWGVDAVDPSNMKKLMSQEKPLGLLPGGF